MRSKNSIDLILDLKRAKKEVVNKKLEAHLNKIVNEEIIKKARNEAKKLLKLANKKEIGDFLYHYHSGIDNIPCLVLDFIKDRLWEEGKLPKNIGKQFGFKIKEHESSTLQKGTL